MTSRSRDQREQRMQINVKKLLGYSTHASVTEVFDQIETVVSTWILMHAMNSGHAATAPRYFEIFPFYKRIVLEVAEIN